ncbi:MAG: hypothetical protein JXQ90_02765 [Cyclobacteriaceae bacterium]
MKYFPILVTLLILSSCTKVEIDGFDKELWSKSIQSCDGYRFEICEKIILPKKNEVLGLNQNEIKSLFGAPPRNELYERNQKFFFYPVDCEGKQSLSVRFDALGRCKEVAIVIN